MPRRTALFALALLALGCAPRQEPPPLAGPFVLTVAATTDVHGRLRGWDYYRNLSDSSGGLARAATVVDSLREADPGHLVLLDAGDLLQGSPLTDVAARVRPGAPHPAIAAMDAMGYDAVAIGNHEFDYGISVLDRAATEARFPMLAANVDEIGGEPAYPAWRIVRRGPVRVGIVGATTPGAMVWNRDQLQGRMVIRDIVPAVRRAVRTVRARGADVVVVLLHSGLDGAAGSDPATPGVPSENVTARVAREVPGIDLLVFGHSHRAVADSMIGSTVLLQPGPLASSVGVARLLLERRDGRWRVVEHRSTLVPTAGWPEAPRLLAATAQAHRATVAYATSALGTTPAAWPADSARVQDTPLADFILETERTAAGAQLAATAIASLDAGLDSGAITLGELARLYPYENTLRAVRISGRALRAYLEQSASYFGTYGTDEPAIRPDMPGYNVDVMTGVAYTIDLTRPAGKRITELTFQGQPVADTAAFTLALNSYRQTGGGGYDMVRGAPVVYDGQRDIRQLLVDEVRRRGTLRPGDYFTQNWRIIPAEAAARAYAAMRAGRAQRARGAPGSAGDAPVPARAAAPRR